MKQPQQYVMNGVREPRSISTAEILRRVKSIGDDALLNHLFIHVYLPHTRYALQGLNRFSAPYFAPE
jgi:hypothetical protein